jgi:4'-phosphopantetheinyl transferase
MAIILKTESPQGQCTAVWKVTETLEQLLGKTTLTSEERKSLSFIRNEARQREWIAVRTLLQELRPAKPVIKYHENGKPYLMDNTEEISISHSGQYIAIALSKGNLPGVDIEHVHTKILRIAERFVSDDEKKALQENIMVEQLCLMWCAKEVLYKIHPEGMLNFKNHLLVSPFILDGKGSLEGFILKEGAKTSHKLAYQRIDDYMLVYTE